MILNPYETTLGLHINTKKLEIELSEFLIKGEDIKNLNYEYVISDDIEVIFITGKNEEEVNLSVWNHPLFINDFKGTDKIFVDLRPYVRIKDKEFSNLKDIVNNNMAFTFIIVRVLYMALLKDSKDNINNINDSIATAFTKWIGNAFKSSLSLDVEDNIKLEIVLMHYILCRLNDEELNDRTVENIYFKIGKNLKVVRGNTKYILGVCSDLNHNPIDAVDLVENINRGVNSSLLNNIDTNLLYNIIGSTWNGIHPTENIAMSLEHIPTLIAIIFTSLNSKTLKHSRISNTLNNVKRDIKATEFEKIVKLSIEDHTV